MDLLDWAGLAGVTAGAALVYTVTGFGFAVLAAPLFLMLVDPAQAIQLVIVISTALSLVALPGLWRVIAPGLLLRLVLGSLAGLPLGLIAFRHADPVLVRAMVGATILGFAVLLGRRRHAGDLSLPFAKRLGLEIATGMVSGIATALIGMAGPPVLIYLLLAGAPPRTVRATLFSFFAFAYAASLASHVVTVGIPARTWLSAGVLIPFAFLGGLPGRPLGDRLGADAFVSSPSCCSGQQGSTPSPLRPVWLFIDGYIASWRDIATRNSDRPRWNRVFLKRRVALQHCICQFGRMTRSAFAYFTCNTKSAWVRS